MSQLFLLKNDVNGNFFHQHHLLYNQIILFIFLILGNLLEAKTYCKVVSEFGLLKEETLTKAIQEEEKKGAEFVTITVDNETAYIIFKTKK
ncbi:hypothetical protein [Fusobacterium polymorphum]|uniref:hypothetical protein n=1 Tax=Fusobacterium nucleatum subsp. polymorphum TaxID=76857 RepID=UPI0030D459A4